MVAMGAAVAVVAVAAKEEWVAKPVVASGQGVERVEKVATAGGAEARGVEKEAREEREAEASARQALESARWLEEGAARAVEVEAEEGVALKEVAVREGVAKVELAEEAWGLVALAKTAVVAPAVALVAWARLPIFSQMSGHRWSCCQLRCSHPSRTCKYTSVGRSRTCPTKSP